MEDLNWSTLNLDKNEASTRGVQIKYMLKIKDGEPISVEQLNYVKDNIVRLKGEDKEMQVFLDSITDFETAADWLSKHAYSLYAAMNLLGIIKHPSGKRGL